MANISKLCITQIIIIVHNTYCEQNIKNNLKCYLKKFRVEANGCNICYSEAYNVVEVTELQSRSNVIGKRVFGSRRHAYRNFARLRYCLACVLIHHTRIASNFAHQLEIRYSSKLKSTLIILFCCAQNNSTITIYVYSVIMDNKLRTVVVNKQESIRGWNY